VKLTMKVTTTMTLESPLTVSDQVMRDLAMSFEAGWRFGVAKDAAMVAEVLRQQHGQALKAKVVDVFFESDLQR
jgi:hypothetical protein